MKSLFILFFLTFTCTLFAQADEYKAVAKTVNYYLEGGTNSDYETLMKAFHEDAVVGFINKENTLEFKKATDFFGGMKPGPKSDRKTRVVQINISGNAASAHLLIEAPTYVFNDYMNLLKFGDEWKIVNKIFHGSKPAYPPTSEEE